MAVVLGLGRGVGAKSSKPYKNYFVFTYFIFLLFHYVLICYRRAHMKDQNSQITIPPLTMSPIPT